jgi:hypothetical protein
MRVLAMFMPLLARQRWSRGRVQRGGLVGKNALSMVVSECGRCRAATTVHLKRLRVGHTKVLLRTPVVNVSSKNGVIDTHCYCSIGVQSVASQRRRCSMGTRASSRSYATCTETSMAPEAMWKSF